MRFIFCLFVLLSINVFAVDLSFEELRWNVDPDEWKEIKDFTMKGLILKIPEKCVSPEKLKVSLRENGFGPIFGIASDDKYIMVSGKVCESKSPLRPLGKNNYSCGGNSCQIMEKGAKKHLYNPLDQMNSSFDPRECPYSYQSTYTRVSHINSEVPFFLIKVIEKSPVSMRYKIDLGGGKFGYMSVDCPEAITESRSESRYEKTIQEFTKVKVSKSQADLNFLLEKLLPCVKTRDLACVKKYIYSPKPSEDFLPTVVTNEILEELKVCLDYHRLLPHLRGTRGIKKVCIFGNRKLTAVDYPEALSSSGYYDHGED